MQIPVMPFKILALAPFIPKTDTAWTKGPVRVEKTNLDHVIRQLNPSLHIALDRSISPSQGLHINFAGIKDMHPDGLIQKTPFLRNIWDAKTFCEQAAKKNISSKEIVEKMQTWPDFPPLHPPAEVPKSEKTTNAVIDDILGMVAVPGQKQTTSSVSTGSLVDQLTQILKGILVRIFSDQDFRSLEAVWRGLQFFLRQGEINEDIELYVVPVSLDTLEETLTILTAQAIQDLPSLLLIDLPFNNSQRHIELLDKISRFSETLLCPALCRITPKFLGLDAWENLSKLPYLPHHLEEPQFAKWHNLKKALASRWLTLTCNRFLTRFSYGPENPTNVPGFNEISPLWIGSVWGLGCLVGQSMAITGWPTKFTDWQHVQLADLALHPTPEAKAAGATETMFSEERIAQLAEAGITPLVGHPNRDIAFAPVESTVAGGSMAYQMLISRLTHFFLWCKDHFEKDLSADVLKKNLTEAFQTFWQKGGDAGPKDLKISIDRPTHKNKFPLHIAVVPSRPVLPSGEAVDLEFLW